MFLSIKESLVFAPRQLGGWEDDVYVDEDALAA